METEMPRFLENVFLDISIDPEGKRTIVCKLVRLKKFALPHSKEITSGDDPDARR
jgi:hypothetical protein